VYTTLANTLYLVIITVPVNRTLKHLFESPPKRIISNTLIA